MTWNAETGPDRYRRAIYTFRRRSLPYPVLQSFDAPNGDFSCVRRQRSNTPLQALATLNEVDLRGVCPGAGAARARIGWSGRRGADYAGVSLVRRPAAERARSVSTLVELLKKERQRIADGWMNAGEIATGKNELPANLPEGVTPAQLAAYTVVARVMLNLDETITKE